MNESTTTDADLHKALVSALEALQALMEAAAPRLTAEQTVALADHLAAGHVVTLIVNRTSAPAVEAALAAGDEILFRLTSPLGQVLEPIWIHPDPGSVN